VRIAPRCSISAWCSAGARGWPRPATSRRIRIDRRAEQRRDQRRIEPDPARRFCRPGARGSLGPLALVATVGGFVGFGGPFRRPPRPRVIAGRLVCTDGDATLELCADGFGARLVDATWAHAEAQASTETGDATVDGRGVVRALGVTATLAEARGASAAATSAAVVAVTLDDSHQVLVLGRREAAA